MSLYVKKEDANSIKHFLGMVDDRLLSEKGRSELQRIKKLFGGGRDVSG